MLPNGEKRQAKTGPTKGDGWQIDYAKKVTGGPLAIGFDESFIIPAAHPPSYDTARSRS